MPEEITGAAERHRSRKPGPQTTIAKREGNGPSSQDYPEMSTKIYSPQPALRNPRLFLSEMFTDLTHSWELALALAKRDISAMYRQSILGYLWAFLPVLATTAIFLFLRSGGAFSTGNSPIPYPVYLLVGSILWQVFVDAVNGPLKVVTTSRVMLVKINFPRESLIIAGLLITLFNFAIRLVILVPALVYFAQSGQYQFTWASLALFPLGVAGLMLLGYMIGLLLTPIGVLFRDVGMGIQIVMGFLMFLAPVVVIVPQSGLVRSLMMANPVSPVLDTSRAWLVGVSAEFSTGFWLVSAVALLFLFVGWIIYRVSLPHVIARLGM